MKGFDMQCGYHTLLSLALVSLLPTIAVKANAANDAPDSKITIGGVVFTDIENPVQSGVQGATVTIEGDNGRFEATTAGIIGLWKVDVPRGTYTVTPKKRDYLIEHFTGAGSDGKRSITIEVTPENMAANQSIRFLAMVWPEEAEEQVQQQQEKAEETETPDTGRTGGGCALVGGSQSSAVDFAVPYVACVSTLFVVTLADTRKRHPPDK